MERYIDAELLKKNIRVNLMPNVDIDGTVTVENAEKYFLNLIDKTSTADVVEVKHGEWIRPTIIHGMTIAGLPHCSVCGEVPCDEGKYCPNCGAKMDEKKNDNDWR